LSDFLRQQQGLALSNPSEHQKYVEIIAFCLMPTHVHLLLKQLEDDGISTFTGNVLNSYARYFNKKHQRKGPLWVDRFKGVGIETDEQLWHVSRYIHLNPTTTNLVDKPELWKFSSYTEALNDAPSPSRLTPSISHLGFTAQSYRRFVENQIDYQKKLAAIKALMID
jgi:putative transposase